MRFSDPLFSSKSAPSLSLDVRFHGVAQRFHVRHESGVFYARGVGSPRLLALFDDTEGLLHAAFVRGNKRGIEAQVRAQLSDGHLGRALALPDPRPGRSGFFRVAWRDDESFCFVMCPQSGEAVVFEPGSPLETDEVWRERDAFWARRWGKEWRDENSDLRLSLRFLTASPFEREQWGAFWAKGDWEEVAQVARLGAIADPDCDLSSPLILSTQLGYIRERAETLEAKRPLSPRLKRLLKTLFERNRVYFNDWSRARRLAPVPFRFAAFPAKGPRLRLEIEAPSAHELLEARFWMRGWIDKNEPRLRRDWGRSSPDASSAD